MYSHRQVSKLGETEGKALLSSLSASFNTTSVFSAINLQCPLILTLRSRFSLTFRPSTAGPRTPPYFLYFWFSHYTSCLPKSYNSNGWYAIQQSMSEYLLKLANYLTSYSPPPIAYEQINNFFFPCSTRRRILERFIGNSYWGCPS